MAFKKKNNDTSFNYIYFKNYRRRILIGRIPSGLGPWTCESCDICGMAENIAKSHNVSVLLYHLVCPAKYRRKVFTEEVAKSLLGVCFEITVRYEIEFLEIGSDRDHVHFLIQGIPRLSPSDIVKVVESITAREIFRLHPEVRTMLWGGHIWSSGYYINTVGAHGTEEAIKRYVADQGRAGEYKKEYSKQLGLF